ncbi:hypothetical protein [Streptomyces liangshanensis]|uniref:hypothetical protein n=1 Tax=Streptomyces liangshanensis TaxID=2717324 RepID=UPI0036D81B30
MVLRRLCGMPTQMVCDLLGVWVVTVRSDERHATRFLDFAQNSPSDSEGNSPCPPSNASSPGRSCPGTAPSPRRCPAHLPIGSQPARGSRRSRPDADASEAVDLRALCESLLPHTPAADVDDFVTEQVPEPRSALACVLQMADTDDGARFWWHYATGAGQAAAAYCFYLHHLALGEDVTGRPVSPADRRRSAAAQPPTPYGRP